MPFILKENVNEGNISKQKVACLLVNCECAFKNFRTVKLIMLANKGLDLRYHLEYIVCTILIISYLLKSLGFTALFMFAKLY